MSKLSVYVIAYNNEPNMRACLESVAGRREESIVVDFPVSIGGIGVYRCGIRALDGYGVRSVLQLATSKMEAVRRWSDSHA
jgi:hypothetical protein